MDTSVDVPSRTDRAQLRLLLANAFHGTVQPFPVLSEFQTELLLSHEGTKKTTASA